MNLAICSLASGSSGNCYVVRSETTAVLVDAGISGKRIREGLARLDMSMDFIEAVLVTHEHTDHTKGLSALAKKGDAVIYANRDTILGMDMELPKEALRTFQTGDSFQIGDIDIQTFPVSHDAADPVGYSFSRAGGRIAIVTDTGVVTEPLYSQMRLADILVIESNHDENILKMGRYPWWLKQRILSNKGHLSNEAAAEALASVIEQDIECGAERRRMVLLAHLSRENNFPEMATATMENILEQHGCLTYSNTRVATLSASELSPVYSI